MKKKIAVVLLSFGLSGMEMARAEFFVGAGVSNHSYEYEDVENSTGNKIYGGYYFENGVFLEAAKVNLGNADVEASSLSFKASGNAAFIGYRMTEASGTSFFGKVGQYSFDTKLNVSGITESSSGLAWGLGLSSRINKHFAVRGEIEQYVGVRDFAGDHSVTGGVLGIELRI